MPRLENLNTLCKVVEQKSFSRAAKILGLSQPAVSLQMKSLETEYGVELLHRDSYEIIPTESGRAVYKAASQIIHLYERSKQQVQGLQESLRGKLLIGASTGPGEYLLPVLLGRFKHDHPQIATALRVGDSEEITDHVVGYRLELGFVGTSRRDRHLSFTPFIQDELVLVVRHNHPLAARSSITYEKLLGIPLILQQYGSGATAALYEALETYNINVNDLNIVMELGLQESTKAAVRSGLGGTIISKLGVVEELKRGILVEVPIEGMTLKREFYIVHRRTSPLTTLAHTFLDYVLEQVDEAVEHIQKGFTLPSL